MALKLAVTTSDTIEHPVAYWKIIQTNLNWLNHSGRFTIIAWHSVEARDGDNPAETIDSIGIDISKEAKTDEDGNITVPSFDDLFGATELDQLAHNPVSQIYTWMKTQSNNSVLNDLDWTKAIDLV